MSTKSKKAQSRNMSHKNTIFIILLASLSFIASTLYAKTIKYTNGNKFTGTVRAGRPYQGVITDKNGTKTFEGTFFNGQLSYNAFRHVMQNNKDVTACVCANDYSAFGVMKYLHNHRLTVGKDFALAGYGNYDISEYLDLTSVDQKVDLIVKQIFCLIEQYESSGTMPSGNFVIPTELKIRESCCA